MDNFGYQTLKGLSLITQSVIRRSRMSVHFLENGQHFMKVKQEREVSLPAMRVTISCPRDVKPKIIMSSVRTLALKLYSAPGNFVISLKLLRDLKTHLKIYNGKLPWPPSLERYNPLTQTFDILVSSGKQTQKKNDS